MTKVRGYFGIGVESGDKPGNLGNLARTAQGFGASFLFTVRGRHFERKVTSDTSGAIDKLPLYAFDDVASLTLPTDCKLVGVELVDGAADLPSFAHPPKAAYVLGPERGSLSPDMQARCDFLVQIPTSLCLNQATAGAVVMYDRVRVLGRWPARPVSSLGVPEPLPPHIHGGTRHRRKT